MMEINKIYNLDVFDFLDNIVKDNSIDLAIIDPPYNLKKAEWDTFKNEEEFFNFTFDWIDKLISKLKDTGSIYIFNTPYNCAYILQYLVKKGLIFRNWITWDKRDGLGYSKKKYANGQETILFFTKSNNYIFNCDAIRTPYESEERIKHASKKGILKNGKRWYPNPNGRLCGEVWHFSSQRHKEKVNGKVVKLPHITPKPLDLIERIVKASSNEGDLILDCFMGIGTTAIVSKKLGRNYIGTELNEEYIKLADRRLSLLK
jgi:site-specific DNA-methyltransferase (adenine-specific)